jgi:Luciferase-like monooxygenase
MRLGLALPQLGPHSGADQITSFARTSEGLGYDSLWVGDRVLAPVAPSDLYPVGGTPQRPYPPEFRSVLDPVVVLSAAAASTTTMRLASSTLNAPWHMRCCSPEPSPRSTGSAGAGWTLALASAGCAMSTRPPGRHDITAAAASTRSSMSCTSCGPTTQPSIAAGISSYPAPTSICVRCNQAGRRCCWVVGAPRR